MLAGRETPVKHLARPEHLLPPEFRPLIFGRSSLLGQLASRLIGFLYQNSGHLFLDARSHLGSQLSSRLIGSSLLGSSVPSTSRKPATYFWTPDRIWVRRCTYISINVRRYHIWGGSSSIHGASRTPSLSGHQNFGGGQRVALFGAWERVGGAAAALATTRGGGGGAHGATLAVQVH